MPLAGGGGVIRRSSAAFRSAFPALLFVSLLLLAYRSAVHLAASRIASVLDRDPDVRSLLSRLSSSPPSVAADAADDRPSDHRHRRHYGPTGRRPRFFHHTGIGILDDDEVDIDHATINHPLRPDRGRPFNLSFLTSSGRVLHLGGRGEQKIRVLQPSTSPILFVFPENDEPGGDGAAGEQGAAADIEIRIFGQGFTLGRGDAMVLAYLMTLFSLVYFFAIVGFLICYSCAIGVVFLTVADFLLGRPRPCGKSLFAGSRLGIRRVLAFVFLRWASRDTVAQFLCVLLFSNIGNQQSLLKLFVRTKLLPFLLTATPLSQWAPGEESGLRWFLLAWGLIERVVALVFVFSYWVAITEHNERRRGPEVVWRGSRLVSMMIGRAIILRDVETMMCWNRGRRVLAAIGGPVFAAVVQSVLEVYFMVIWLVCYFDMRCREGELHGRRFGRRNLENCINGLQ